MNELMECLKRSDKQGILRVVQRDYVLKEKVKKIIEERIILIKDIDKYTISGIKCKDKKVYSTTDVVMGLIGLKKELELK